MPNAKKYQRIKNDPIRYKHMLEKKRNWIKINRSKYPFTHYQYDFKKRKQTTISAFEFWKLAKKQKLICALTGRKLTGDTMSVDHIIPLSNGGTNDISNLRFVHVDVNYARRNLPDEIFVKLCEDVVKHNSR